MSTTSHPKYYLNILLSLISLLAFPLSANEADSYEEIHSEFYVTVDRFVILNEGVFVNVDEGGLLPIRSMLCVGEGIYLIKVPECPKHGLYCPKCDGCYPTNKCPYRCKCAPMDSPWLKNSKIINQAITN